MMSSITQARLAPITQRYMSMSFRCHRWSNGKTKSSNLENHPATLNFDYGEHNICQSHSNGSRFKSSSSLSIREQEQAKRGTFCYQRFRVNVDSVNRSAGGFCDTKLAENELQHRYQDDQSKFQMNLYPSYLNDLLSLTKGSSNVKDRLVEMLNIMEPVHISSCIPRSHRGHLSRCWRHQRSREKRSENEERFKFNTAPFYLSLSVLGLFSKPLEAEKEEQKDLTDEQKMKKMKPVELKIAKGVLLMCDQDYTRANQLFHEALHIAQDENDEERENQILNLIAANYFESGDLENAEKLFIDIMKRMIALDVASTAPPILELSLKLASIYSKSPSTHEKALKGFKFVINSLLYKLEDIVNNIEDLQIHALSHERRDELALLGWAYDWFAKHLLNMNDYRAAADMLQRAVQISSLVLGPLHDQTLILLNDIGTTLAMNNSPEEGKIFITKAVEGAISSQSKELASFYVNLGLVNLKLRKLDEAKRYCEYSMELAKKNRDHYNTQEVIELSQTCLDEVRKLLDGGEQ